ncbi:hypothetical protein L596_029007 [Steinernema carpocapsae]|uniref:Uncharacterized protein n=1 Tax=Steinernema carpocapsae TaxID=34508 RepID=A0A4U5LTC5_STECR|nr:hypothetical protein L596_029007 [Steinernema carpocapsae]
MSDNNFSIPCLSCALSAKSAMTDRQMLAYFRAATFSMLIAFSSGSKLTTFLLPAPLAEPDAPPMISFGFSWNPRTPANRLKRKWKFRDLFFT